MSSAMRVDMGLTRRLLDSIPANSRGLSTSPSENSQPAIDKLRRLGLSPRQQVLNDFWSWYRCEKYSGRKVDWNGKQNTDRIETEAIASQGFLPAGFYDAGSTLPIRFRRPSTPYALVKVIVDRFTGLLFSERHHPQIHIEGDQDTDDYLTAIAKVARLWPAMIKARTFGGAMGSVAVGFQFIAGAPHIEVHDPRWLLPTFADRSTHTLKSIEKRYIYIQDVRTSNGIYEQVEMWYRRVIDEQSDTLYAPVEVGDGEEPVWRVQTQVMHNLGFCPVVWTQNLPVDESIDGDSDCVGVYDLVEAIDALLSQANKGTLANCDPTAVISTDAEMSEVRKGSDNAIKLPAGGSADYMEITGAGPKSAVDLAQTLRTYALEVAQCVLDQGEQQKTATEVERTFSAMIAKADVMREQYGEKCVKPLLEMMLKAVRVLKTGQTDPETGRTVKGIINLPPRPIKDEETGEVTYEKMELPDTEQDPMIQLQWPRYFEPVLADVELASRAAIAAKAGGLIDKRHAVKYVAEYFEIENVDDIIEKIDEERRNDANEAEQATIRAMQSQAPGDTQGLPELGGDDADVSGMDKLADTAGGEDTGGEDSGAGGSVSTKPGEASAGPQGADVQKQALNGAQFDSMSSIVAQVAAREIPRESAVTMLSIGLQIDEQTADRILGPAGKTFFTKGDSEDSPPKPVDAPMPSNANFRQPPQPPKAPKPGDDEE